MSIQLSSDLNASTVPLRHAWRECVGSGHATLALRADWQAQMRQARAELGFRYVRFHGLLSDDMGTLICQDDALLYSFFNADQIFDFLHTLEMYPIVELTFMPQALASGGETVFHYRGNITPPRELGQWAELMRRMAAHWVERYGIDVVAQWYFEVWNEPNLPAFWTGGQQAYFDLYEASARAIKSVDARLRVGGPATAQNAWLPEFLAFCGQRGLPVDFVSTHYYPTDAFGQPGADTETQLEHAPLGVMRERALAARAQARQRPLLYTEWNVSSNPRDPMHDSASAAALALRIALSVDDVVDAYSYWTLSDIFEENYFPSVPFHGGFGLFNLHSIKKPIYNAFEMLVIFGDRHYPLAQTHPTVLLWIGEPQGDGLLSRVFCVNQAMPRHPIAAEDVELRLRPRPGLRLQRARIARIDADHANPRRLWQQMGSPEYLSAAQADTLRQASMPQSEELALPPQDDAGHALLTFQVAPQSVNLLSLEWERS